MLKLSKLLENILFVTYNLKGLRKELKEILSFNLVLFSIYSSDIMYTLIKSIQTKIQEMKLAF